MTRYTKAQVKAMGRTARSRGAVGSRATVVRHVCATTRRGDPVLDYGCGDGTHADMLWHRFGVCAVGYDVARPRPTDEDYLSRKYQTVYASNVLNVQPSVRKAVGVIDDMARLVQREGRLVVNYPRDPAKHERNVDAIIRALLKRFRRVVLVDGTMAAPVLEARHPKAVYYRRRAG